MARKTTRTYSGLLRGYGNDRPDVGFTMGDQLLPVVMVADESQIAEKVISPTILTRLYLAAGGAGIWSIAGYTAPFGGALVKTAESGGNTRVMLFDDGTDGISTVTTPAIDPPGQFRTRAPYAGRLRYGTHNADPNPGTEFLLLIAGDIVRDVYLPAGCAISFTGTAANQIVSLGWVHIVEGVDG